jgi:zinc transporter 2
MLMELVGGLIANSVALISDSFHMLTDISALFISMISIILSTRKGSKLYTYGYHRTEALGALVGVFMIWGLIIWMIIESV